MATGSPRQPVDVVLHIGSGKAGSKSIQHFLSSNRERLCALGVLYPRSPGAVRHSRLGLFIKSVAELEEQPIWHRQTQTDPARFRRAFRRKLLTEIEVSHASRVVLSDEVLFACAPQALRRLCHLTDQIACSKRLVVYLRRQDDHLVSRYQQGVKIGRVLRLREWARADRSDLYDYHSRLCTWERLLAPTEFVVRRFEPDGFVGGSLFQDFLTAAGLDVRAETLVQVPTRNVSLDAESVEFLRLFNLYRVEHEAATPGQIDNRAVIKSLAEVSTGPTLTLPADFLDEFMAQWEGSNRRVAVEFLGHQDGQLFHLQRKSHGTTVEQRLEPTRLNHFFDVLQLPMRMRLPLRKVVEREAKVR
jgi:hypothetical protein